MCVIMELLRIVKSKVPVRACGVRDYYGRQRCKGCQMTHDEYIRRARETRLWHWLMALTFRQAADHMRQLVERSAFGEASAVRASFELDMQEANRAADFHIKRVQELNDLFPVGDTAEKDSNEQIARAG